MTNYEQFKDAKYGLMLHFGLYSLLGGVYNGNKGPYYAEWIQCHQQIHNSEMERLASIFNPIYLNTDEICEFAVKCGMKYIVITAKHHEGFALFRSAVDKFNSYDASPCKRDIIKELSDSCKKYGLKLGLYYSQCIDWHEKHGGGYLTDPSGAAGMSWENSWDFPNKAEKDYDICFNNKILPQIKELMTNYGDIFLAWFDMPLDSTKRHSQIIYDCVKQLQPNCLINSRLGNGVYDYVSLGDNEIPDEIVPVLDDVDYNAIYGIKKSPHNLYESACTLNCSWGYTVAYPKWREPGEVLNTRLKLEKLGINYLINIGPDWLGRLPYEAKEILLKVQEEYLK